MSTAATRFAGAQPSSAAVAARRAALVMAILISGGNLIIPRVPILALLLLLAGIAYAATPAARQREPMFAIFGLLALVLVVNLYRSGLSELSALITRYANFAAGIALLAMYLRAGRNAFVGDFSRVALALSWVAILTIVLSIVVRPLFQPIEVQETTYYHLFYIFNFHVTIEDSAGIMRANGPFFEPGVFHIYLNLYLYICLFVSHKFRHAVVAAAAIAATQSTTGVVIASGIVALFVLRMLGQGSLHRRTAILVVGVIAAAIAAGPVIENVRSKLVGDFAGSGMARQFDLITGVNVVMAHPVAGIGFDPESYRQLSGAYAFEDTILGDHITEDRGNTNGILVLLYSLGIPLALPFMWGLFRQTMLPDRLLVGGIIFVSLLTESIALTPFFLLFIFSGLLLAPRLARARRSPQVRAQFPKAERA